MKHPQVIVWERDGRLAQLIRQTVHEQRWTLHEPRQMEPCLQLLRGCNPTVLVVKLSPRLDRDLSLLERTGRLMPLARAIVVGDVENDTLANLAWDLGASLVLFPPLPHDWLADAVTGLMKSLLLRRNPVTTAGDAETGDAET